jgi:hypothetical protein
MVPKTPRIGMHHRFPSLTQDVTPGPGTYDVPAQIKPSRSRGRIHGRTGSVSGAETPGPAAYVTEQDILRGVRPIGMHVRTAEREDVNPAPYRDTRRPVSETPKYSMRAKYVLAGDETPGGVYISPPFGSDARKATMSSKHKVIADDPTPSPVQYRPKTGEEIGSAGQRSTLHGLADRGFDVRFGGPAGPDYAPDYGSVGQRSPRFTMKGAKYDPEKDRTGEYVGPGTTLKGPKYSMRPNPPLAISYT